MLFSFQLQHLFILDLIRNGNRTLNYIIDLRQEKEVNYFSNTVAKFDCGNRNTLYNLRQSTYTHW